MLSDYVKLEIGGEIGMMLLCCDSKKSLGSHVASAYTHKASVTRINHINLCRSVLSVVQGRRFSERYKHCLTHL